MSQTLRRILSICLITIFILDHAAMFVNALDLHLYNQPQSEDAVCGCTCCGDVCPMGASCCCFVPNENESPQPVPLQITENACSPNPFQQHEYSFFFTSVKWIETNSIVLQQECNENAMQDWMATLVHSRTTQPPTPPPNR